MFCILLTVFVVLLILHLLIRVTVGHTRSPKCLVGKTAIVTGGNSGIGYQTCLNLASRGCRVIIADKDDSEESRKNIIEKTGNESIISKKIDLSSFASVRKFASDILENEVRLDILVNNAGVGYLPFGATEDGLNRTMQVNYFGAFLLTSLLISLLEKSRPSRIVFTTSIVAFNSILRPSTLRRKPSTKTENGYATLWTYADSKMANLVASNVFAERLAKRGISSNAIHPGWVLTPIFNRMLEQNGSLQRLVAYFFLYFAPYFGKDAWEGGQCTTHAAISDDAGTGGHFWDCKRFPQPPQTPSGKSAEKIFEISIESVGLTDKERELLE